MRNIAVCALLVIGIFFPTSMKGEVSSTFILPLLVSTLTIYSYLIFSQKKIKIVFLIIGLIINSTLWFATLISPFNDYAFGSSMYYLTLTILFCINLKNIEYTKNINNIFIFVNLIIILLSILIILNNSFTYYLFSTFYSAFYIELLPNMLSQNKPVLSFASHSLAGFFMYLLFYINLKKYLQNKNNLYLLCSVFYIIIIFSIKSNTAYVFLLIALLQFSFLVLFKNKISTIITSIALLTLGFIYFDKISSFIADSLLTIKLTLSSSNNGFLGRYGASGNLKANIDYILNHPFNPIGFGYNNSLTYVDSGFIEYATRGSIVVMLAIYIGLFLFLKYNLYSKKTAYYLFFIIMLFEFSFSGLTYYRTFLLLPFIIIFLNGSEDQITKSNKQIPLTI